MKKKCAALIFVFAVLAFAQFLPCRVQAQSVDVAVTAIDIGGSGAGDLNTWLITQPYHAPRAGVPYMKLNPASGNTEPLVSVSATVTRTDSNMGLVLVDVDFQAITPASTVWSLWATTLVMDVSSSAIVGPATISIPAPVIAIQWTLQVIVTITSGETNINPSPNWVDTSFYRLGFCDVNKDNIVDGKEIALVRMAIPSRSGSARWNWLCDVDCSGAVTIRDYRLALNNIPTVYSPIP